MAHRPKRRDATKSKEVVQPKRLTLVSSQEKFLKFRQEVAGSNQTDLLRKISGLLLLPANQNHVVGLIAALEIASTVGATQVDSLLPSSRLATALNQHLLNETFVGKLEDPPANLFTENIIFNGSNYVVFTGFYPSGSFILTTLLESIFLNKGRFSENYFNAIGACSTCLLAISNAIANRAGHPRFVDGINETSSQILVPGDEDLDRLGTAVSFTKSELIGLLKQYGLGIESLKPFICKPMDIKISFERIENSIICKSPLIELENSFVVVPSMIVDAIIQFILIMSLVSKETDVLALAYHDRLRSVTFENLALLSHGNPHILADLTNLNEDVEVAELAMKIDIDKLLYVQFVSDDLSGLGVSLSRWDSKRIISKCSKRQGLFEKAMKNSPKESDSKILTLRVVGTIGRSCSLGSHRDLTLSFTGQDLYILASMNDVNFLTLWKYANLLDASARDRRMILSFGPLDTFAAYYLGNRTFDYGERKVNSFVIPPNLDRALRVKALVGTDRHAELRDNPTRYTSIVLQFESDSAPIYMTDNPHSDIFGLMVGGFPQPVWVSKMQEGGMSRKDIEFMELIAHWLAAVVHDLRPFLECQKGYPLEISVGTDQFVDLAEIDRDDRVEVESRKIPLTIRCHGTVHVSAGFEIGQSMRDGTFDLHFVEHLLNCIGELLKELGSDALTEEEGKRIAVGRFSATEKSGVFEGPVTGHGSLIGKGLPELRPVQKHDQAVVMRKLVGDLSHKFRLGETYESTTDTNAICNQAVGLILADLRTALSAVRWKDLLIRLIEQNEVICHTRAKNVLSIGQYIKLYGFSAKIVDSHVSENPRLDATALAVRTLIEICAAEPSKGYKRASLTDLDELIAESNQLMTWANLSDRIHLGMSRPRIRLLKSGRIEIDRDAIEEQWSKFYRVRSTEDLERFYGVQPGSSSSSSVTEGERQEAYEDEFGLTYSELIRLFAAITMMGLDQGQLSFEYASVVDQASLQLGMPAHKVDTVLSSFSLHQRTKWEEPPEGYDSKEIQPWKFNRKLSFMSRPLITGHTAEGTRILLFGPRHVEESIRYLDLQVETGRYVSRDKNSKMATLIGNINREAGDRFTDVVYDWFVEHNVYVVGKRVTISPGGKVPAPTNLGDIDVLAVDRNSKVILLVECKKLQPARNPHEISQELERVFGNSETDRDSSIQKHKRRSDWVMNNLEVLPQEYGVSPAHKVLPIFVTSIEIPSKYMVDSGIRFLAYSSLQKNGLDGIRRLYP